MREPIYDDPIVAEIHAIRAAMLDECDGDIKELMRRLAVRQKQSGHQIITRPLRNRTEQSDAAEPK